VLTTLGGCCPSNYICGRAGCSPPVGVAFSETCGFSSYLCPASLGYGCCPNGLGCGISNCYSTEVVSYTIVDTVITTEGGELQTLTSTVVTATTPAAPTALATTSESGILPKVVAPTQTAIAKTKATDNSSGGLTKVQLGGIIGGAVILLMVLLVITFFIFRRLNQFDRAIEEAKTRTTSNATRSQPSRIPRHTAAIPEIDNMSIDPLIMTSSEVTQSVRSLRHGSQQSQQSQMSHEVEASSPPFFHSPFSSRSPPYNNYAGGYAPVAVSDTSSSGHRNSSLESTPGFIPSPAEYFDIPPQSRNNFEDQNLKFGYSPHTAFQPRRPSQHERQWSQSSSQSQVSIASSNIVELEASDHSDRHIGLRGALQGLGMRLSMRKRKSSITAPNLPRTSEPMVLTGGPTNRPDWVMSSAGLGHIAEAGESRVDLQELGNGTLSPATREQLLKNLEKTGRYRQLNETPQIIRTESTESPGHATELLRDIDLGP
jgi:hypothetical protein